MWFLVPITHLTAEVSLAVLSDNMLMASSSSPSKPYAAKKRKFFLQDVTLENFHSHHGWLQSLDFIFLRFVRIQFFLYCLRHSRNYFMYQILDIRMEILALLFTEWINGLPCKVSEVWWISLQNYSLGAVVSNYPILQAYGDQLLFVLSTVYVLISAYIFVYDTISHYLIHSLPVYNYFHGWIGCAIQPKALHFKKL